MDEILSAAQAMYIAQEEAEKKGEENFVCPLCGGVAWWGRSSYNGHLHMGCNNCDFRIMQ